MSSDPVIIALAALIESAIATREAFRQVIDQFFPPYDLPAEFLIDYVNAPELYS